ncbi:MAG: hypothetical protein H7Y15_05400 [Pseudonocardia sp.]|nr:hypothetical protein [Pseudonocardia sp.]
MRYETLDESDLHVLARERVHALEADHFHWQLRLAEAVEPAEQVEIERKLTELARRIGVHTVEDTDTHADEPLDPTVQQAGDDLTATAQGPGSLNRSTFEVPGG